MAIASVTEEFVTLPNGYIVYVPIGFTFEAVGCSCCLVMFTPDGKQAYPLLYYTGYSVEGVQQIITEACRAIPTGATNTTNSKDQVKTNEKQQENTTDMTSTAAKPIPKTEEVPLAFKDVSIVRRGDQIILPEEMTLDEAAKWIQRRKVEEEQVVAIDEFVDAYPLEGAHAFQKALAKKYGWVSLVPTPGFFGSSPPIMVGVEVGVGKTDQVAWGDVQIPGVEGTLTTGFGVKDERFHFSIRGTVKQKYKKEVAEIANLTREFVRKESIYRGQALRVNFPDPSSNKFSPAQAPRFMDTSGVDEKSLILNADLHRLVETALFTPIEKTQLCREYKIPLKRGILLEGPYGVGKTQTANVVAKKARENGWTFLYLDDVTQLATAIRFAQQYQPCVIFAEDIDRAITGERSSQMDAVLNTIDGIDTKASETLVVLTTNHVKNINVAMLRPGRLDTVISVKAPDAESVRRLVTLYARGLLADSEDLTRVGQKLAGQIPAVIREVVERSKLSAVSHAASGETLFITALDLETSADGMLAHLELMREKPEDTRTGVEKLGNIVGMYIQSAIEIAKQAHPTDVNRALNQPLPEHLSTNGVKSLPLARG